MGVIEDCNQAAYRMIADAQAFYQFGWMLGTSGNLSIRCGEGQFLITASGRDKSRLTVEDFILCDLDGQPVHDDETRKPSAETLIHSVVYEEIEGAGAVYHVHEPYAALCSNRDVGKSGTTFRKLEMIKGLDIWEVDEVEVPLVPNDREIPRLADEVRTLLNARVPAVNIMRHGFYAWGATPFEAKRHVETLAYLFRFSWENSRYKAQ